MTSTDSIDQIQPMTADVALASASIRVQQNADRATLIFLVSSVYEKLFGKQLKTAHSLGDGIYCYPLSKEPVTQEMLDQLKFATDNFMQEQKQLEHIAVPRMELIKLFKANNRRDKLGVLKTLTTDPVPCVRCGEFVDYILEPMTSDLSKINVWGLRTYQNGFVLRTPSLLDPTKLREWTDPAAQHEMFNEYTQWAERIGVSNIAQLNELIFKRDIEDLKWTCEGLHQRKLAAIAKKLVAGFPHKRVVTIAGPSSSNKTTFAKRLEIALRTCGYQALVIEMDDYFMHRDETPFGPDGLRDFEAITALNVKLLSDNVHRLVNGETIHRRKYDFKSGLGFDVENELQTLKPNQFLILEGIHGLNPELLNHIGHDQVTPIYVSPLTPLSIDNTHRFPTTDLRLIRRIIRDHKFRGYSARKTIHRWTSVRVGEEKNIFPFQGNAEMFFNSSLVYELPVLSIQGRTLLAEATVPEENEDPNDPMTKEVTREARRLLGLIDLFYAIPMDEVPHISCIREFVGGSDLKY